jgi:hypothetical protein
MIETSVMIWAAGAVSGWGLKCGWEFWQARQQVKELEQIMNAMKSKGTVIPLTATRFDVGWVPGENGEKLDITAEKDSWDLWDVKRKDGMFLNQKGEWVTELTYDRNVMGGLQDCLTFISISNLPIRPHTVEENSDESISLRI